MASKETAMLPWPELGATLLPEIVDNRKLRHQLLETASAHCDGVTGIVMEEGFR